MRTGIAGRIGPGSRMGMPRVSGGPGMGRMSGPQRVVIRRRARRFDPFSPLAGLGDFEAVSSVSDAVVDQQSDVSGLRSWLSDAFKGVTGKSVSEVLPGVIQTIIPGGGAFSNLFSQGAKSETVGPVSLQPTTGQGPSTVIVAPEESLPKWAIPVAIGVAALLFGVVALKK